MTQAHRRYMKPSLHLLLPNPAAAFFKDEAKVADLLLALAIKDNKEKVDDAPLRVAQLR